MVSSNPKRWLGRTGRTFPLSLQYVTAGISSLPTIWMLSNSPSCSPSACRGTCPASSAPACDPSASGSPPRRASTHRRPFRLSSGRAPGVHPPVDRERPIQVVVPAHVAAEHGVAVEEKAKGVEEEVCLGDASHGAHVRWRQAHEVARRHAHVAEDIPLGSPSAFSGKFADAVNKPRGGARILYLPA